MKYKSLHKRMHLFAPKFVGEKTMGQVMYWARKIFKNENAQINRLIDRDNIALSAYTVGGFFHQMKQYGESDIELYIVFNENDKNMLFPICQNGAKLIIDELFKTYVHEKRHRYQFRKRGKASARRYKCPISDLKLKEEMEYYGDSDELDAYAQEAVIEMRTMGYSNAMEKYKELFDKHDKKVYNRFLKKYYKFEDKISL
jgi:hypothetical protein